MKLKMHIIALAIAAVALTAAVFVLRAPIGPSATPPIQEGTPPSFAEKSVEMDAVSVSVQPEAVGGMVRFTIALNTHSVDLSRFSAEHQLRLRIDGEEIAPASTENETGSGPSSHHRIVTATFPYSGSTSFALAVRNLDGETEAELSWP